MSLSFPEGLGNGQLNSLARSNASIYGNKEDLYDRLRRHAYQGKKGNTLYFILRIKSFHYNSFQLRRTGTTRRVTAMLNKLRNEWNQCNVPIKLLRRLNTLSLHLRFKFLHVGCQRKWNGGFIWKRLFLCLID